MEGCSPSLWHDKHLKAFVVLAVLMHLVILAYLAIYPLGIFAKRDSGDYHVLGVNLLHHNVFGYFTKERGIRPNLINGVLLPPSPDIGQEHRFQPDPLRTPGYPLFLALIYRLGGGPYTAILMQSLLSILTLWLTVLLAALIFQQPSLTRRAAFLAAVNPLNLTFSHQLMSDSLFTLLLLGAVWFYLKILLAPDLLHPWICSVLAGLFLGSAILTRPVGIYFPVVLIIWLLAYQFWLGNGPTKVEELTRIHSAAAGAEDGKAYPRLRFLAVFIAVTVITIAPWVVRNYCIFQRVFISTSSDHNLLFHTGAQIETSLRYPNAGEYRWRVHEQLEADLITQMSHKGLNTDNEADRAAYFREWSLKKIKAHPLLAIRPYIKGMITQFFSDVPSFYELFSITREGQAQGTWGVLVQQGLRPALLHYFGPNWPFWVGAAVPLIVYDIFLYILSFWGVVALCRSRNCFLLLILLSVIGYFLVISAFIGFPRFRLPAMPFYVILAALGWHNWTCSPALALKIDLIKMPD
jgi:hypothetical protein